MTLSATRLVAKGITMTGQESSRNQCLCFLLFHSSLPFLRVLPLLGHFLSHQPARFPLAPGAQKDWHWSRALRGAEGVQNSVKGKPKIAVKAWENCIGAVKSVLLWVRCRCRFPFKRRLRLTGWVSLTPFALGGKPVGFELAEYLH